MKDRRGKWPPLVGRIKGVIAARGGEARVVGGAVRDMLAGVNIAALDNIDMASTMTPDAATRALEAAGLKVIPTGVEHGTITVLDESKDILVELTTLREDIKTDGRHAEVRFGTDWRRDAERRDFTINTMSVDSGGTIYDPFGGRDDLAANTVRFVGDAATRIREDYLRILRFFRFHARFGKNNAPDADAMRAIADNVSGLDFISGERIAHELCGILWQKNPSVIGAMMDTGVDHAIVEAGFSRDGDFTSLIDFDLKPIAWLGYLVNPRDAGAVAKRLRFSNRHRGLLEYMTLNVNTGKLESPEWEQAAWYLLGGVKEGLRDSPVLAAQYVLGCARENRKPDPKIYRRLHGWKKPRFPVGGADLRALGIPTGRGMGKMLSAIERAWVESGFTMSRDSLLQRLKEMP